MVFDTLRSATDYAGCDLEKSHEETGWVRSFLVVFFMGCLDVLLLPDLRSCIMAQAQEDMELSSLRSVFEPQRPRRGGAGS